MEGDDKRILLVDDNRDLRRLVALLLMSAGYSVSEAGDGLEAVAELKRRRYDAILTDVRMPRLSGRELLKICRDSYPLTPVIVLSSDFHLPADGHPPVSAEDGAFACLSKPVDARLLLFAVRNALADRDPALHSAAPPPKGVSLHWKPGPPPA
ncbi:MAG TPA: response regulator [Nitrospiraceae bacterium]|nr:response regulator [Nitrospiraceae bacterium]